MLTPEQIEWAYKYNKEAIDSYFDKKICYDCDQNKAFLWTRNVYIWNICSECAKEKPFKKCRKLNIQEIFTLQILRRN